MKRLALYLSIICSMCVLSSCESDSTIDWGKTKFYEDSFLWKYEPVIMTKTLKFDFNDVAKKRYAGKEFVFQVTEFSLEQNRKIVAKSVKVYKNGVLCPNNEFVVTPEEQQVNIGIEFLPGATPGKHHLYLECQSLNLLDQFDNMLDSGFDIVKKDVMNPANKGLMWLAIVLAATYLLWLCFLRPIFYPYVKFSRMVITYPGGEECMVRTAGKTAVILTNKEKAKRYKQGFFSTLFMTKHLVVVNDVWTSTVTIKSKKGRYHRIAGSVGYTPDEPERGEVFTLITDEGVRVNVETN